MKSGGNTCPLCAREETGNINHLSICSRCIQFLLGNDPFKIAAEIRGIACRRPINEIKVELILGFYGLNKGDVIVERKNNVELNQNQSASHDRGIVRILGHLKKGSLRLEREIRNALCKDWGHDSDT